ncbi:multiple organellar RNA editing factor 7, mitochondrial isoform X2 [Raphanus sativus]|uniref:Multiple organellar RNA editing factor 7, mitochondrial isoform X2 n=1 Tax=Raphanus sativus TaxID=3726 RepID=A0A9W3CDI5_RAPSA|nr:multiple organellar RNA editing factor 7, mitochondrial isoform X2 [Raphanus sativus]
MKMRQQKKRRQKSKHSVRIGGSDTLSRLHRFTLGRLNSMASILRSPLNLTAAFRFRLAPLFPFSVEALGYVNVVACFGATKKKLRDRFILFPRSTTMHLAAGFINLLTDKIRSLPDVRWVLPDSYIVDGDSGYGEVPCGLATRSN